MSHPTVAGIDVGGDRKGCHLVILRGQHILCNTNSREPRELLQRCEEFQVEVIGIDAPCCWKPAGAGRAAEHALARERISCFATPTRERALANRSGFYGWMFNGERVYQALTERYPLQDSPIHTGSPVCFETFPHAITCALLGTDRASARHKLTQRRQLLADEGIDPASLKSIDTIDAALCALTARYFCAGRTRAYGEANSGYILVPAPHPTAP